MMLSQKEIQLLAAVCSMSLRHGSYHYLVEGPGGWPMLSHVDTGHVIYPFGPEG